MNSGKLLLGVLAGIASGAMLGILFAPDKGSKTRGRIVEKGEDYADGLKTKFSKFVDSLDDNYQEAISEAERMFTKGKSKYDKILQDADKIVGEGKAAYNDANNGVV